MHEQSIAKETHDSKNSIALKGSAFTEKKKTTAPTEIGLIYQWAIEDSLNQKQVQGMINILLPRLLPQLAKSVATFLITTSATYHIKSMNGANDDVGEFVYFGIAQGLQDCIDPEVFKEPVIPIQINVDGIPIYVSSTLEFWPILCKVFFKPDIYKPFPIAIYCGKSKPKSVDDYLRLFIFELNSLLRYSL